VTVASRFGRLTLRRQVLAAEVGGNGDHVVPGNVALPPHGGLVITRGLQELACLLPDTLPFVSAERLLGWQTQAAPEAKAVLCASTLRTVVREHGAALAEAEWAEVTRLRAALARGDGAAEDLRPRLVPARTPRRRAGWPAALSVAVDQALAAGAIRPPQGVRAADWERVLAARRQERADASAEDLRRLGPIRAGGRPRRGGGERGRGAHAATLAPAVLGIAHGARGDGGGLSRRERDGGHLPGHPRRALRTLPGGAHRGDDPGPPASSRVCG